jgi:hypothetical protein
MIKRIIQIIILIQKTTLIQKVTCIVINIIIAS